MIDLPCGRRTETARLLFAEQVEARTRLEGPAFTRASYVIATTRMAPEE